MATLDPEQTVVGRNGNVYTAPFGTALPDTVAEALDAAFVNVGLLTEDGVTQNDSRERVRFHSWQRSRPIRILETGQTTTYTAAMQQWNADNFILAFGGGEVTEVEAGQYRFDPADLESSDEFSFIVEWSDQGFDYRAVAERGFISEDVEFNLTRSDLATLPIGLEVLASTDLASGWYLLTDNPAFEPAS